MGRREKPVDPDAGPVQRFAHDLRLLREKAGRPPYREMAQRAGFSVSALSQAAAGDQLPSLAVVRAYAEALDADPGEWERRWRETDDEVRVPDPDERPPYRGLARFEPGDSDLFFGRDRLVDDVLGRVREHRFAAVFGASGSGKSSLLRAGLIPRLRQAASPDRPAVIRVLAPGERPARTHEAAFVPREGVGDTWVIVDRFEEAFTLCHDREERDRFLDSRLRAVIAVRGGFYGHCASHREPAEAVSRSGLPVGPMSRDELRDAVVKPAQAAGLTVERALAARNTEEIGRPAGRPGHGRHRPPGLGPRPRTRRIRPPQHAPQGLRRAQLLGWALLPTLASLQRAPEADDVVAESDAIMRTATELPGRFGYDRAEHRLHVAEAHLTLERFDRAAAVARDAIAAAPPETPGWAAATLVLALAEARDTPEQAATRALGVLDLIPSPRLRAAARNRLTRLQRLLDTSTAPAAAELAERLRTLPVPIRSDGTAD